MDERRLAGSRHGDAIIGVFKNPPGRMNCHWIDNGAGRMFWCGCLRGFRLGGRVHYGRQVFGRKRRTPGYMPRPYWHSDRAAA